ncbi:hypothetical protein ETB97_006582 [Aspergillus alliaceus]|uniref:Chromatin modification-related protein EAF6 n=1 Tax=Petromyces alliaceus TaxID=209559 RepID=A0A8H6E9Q7_PETAA|nr:hypothetical protein ETB97_006582 [Aspergillus burnettii]
MTESAPPPSVPNTTATPAGPTATTNQSITSNNNGNGTASSQSGANRGIPYYEKLRRELRDTLQKKRLMDKSMAQLEDQIFRFEQSYLEETTAGNIIKGFDNYIKGSSSGPGGAASLALSGGVGGTRRKAQVTDSDRVFSRSSASFMRVEGFDTVICTDYSVARPDTDICQWVVRETEWRFFCAWKCERRIIFVEE